MLLTTKRQARSAPFQLCDIEDPYHGVKGTCTIREEEITAMPVIKHVSNLIAALAEKMRELSGVLRLVKQGKAGQAIHVHFGTYDLHYTVSEGCL